MKRGKKPTRRQKIIMSSIRLVAANWLVLEDNEDFLTIIHKHTDTVRKIKKLA